MDFKNLNLFLRELMRPFIKFLGFFNWNVFSSVKQPVLLLKGWDWDLYWNILEV